MNIICFFMFKKRRVFQLLEIHLFFLQAFWFMIVTWPHCMFDMRHVYTETFTDRRCNDDPVCFSVSYKRHTKWNKAFLYQTLTFFFLAKNINVSVKLPFKGGVKKEKLPNTVCYNRLIVGYTVSAKLNAFSHCGVATGDGFSKLLMFLNVQRLKRFQEEMLSSDYVHLQFITWKNEMLRYNYFCLWNWKEVRNFNYLRLCIISVYHSVINSNL